MRNLSVIDHRRRVVAGSVPSDAHLCVDPVTQAAYLVTSQGIQCLAQDPPQDTPPRIVWGEHGITTGRVVAAEFVAAACGGVVVCVVTVEGLLITVAVEDGQAGTQLSDSADGHARQAHSCQTQLMGTPGRHTAVRLS
ncbi:hypothetical protein GWK47_019483 [Chionoecetes opilio]|uniref:Uncharacterized protein n=1 Tax=Chionoecetes opilio TaxID=41210 RepID=A0A8J4XQ78_CHIOP|nr:hypothetical protein GWK47_019483 [Chionoecetes opilio]